MHWNDDLSYHIIEKEDIDKIAKKSGLELPIQDIHELHTEWYNYAYIDAINNELDEIYSGEFAYTISGIMTGVGVDHKGTRMYFKEKIEDYFYTVFLTYKNNDKYTEKEAKQEIYKKLMQDFKDDKIRKYEKTIKLHTIKLSDKNYFLFLDLEGKTNRARIINNLDKYHDVIPSNHPATNAFSVQLTYSEEKAFRNIKGSTATEKILHLLPQK